MIEQHTAQEQAAAGEAEQVIAQGHALSLGIDPEKLLELAKQRHHDGGVTLGWPMVIHIVEDLRRGHAAAEERDALAASNEQREAILNWLANGETGASSKAMAWAVLGIQGSVFHPYGPADLRRCVQLMEEIPSIRRQMHVVSALSPTWRVMVDDWDSLESLLKREMAAGTGSAPLTYRRMKELRRQAEEASQ